MVRIGDALPPGKRREYIIKQLVPGCIVRLTVKFQNKTKPKLLVLVAEGDPDYLVFIANSNIHPYIFAKKDLLKCQVKMDAASHPFLRHDSYLACHEVKRLRREEVVQELMSDLSGIKGAVSAEVRDQVMAAVKFAITLTPAEKKQILASLNS